MSEDGTRDERRAELLAAALGGELSASEARELDELRTTDPTVDAELGALRDVVGRLGALDRWTEVEGAAASVDAVLAAADGVVTSPHGQGRPSSGRRARDVGGAAAPRPAGSTRPNGRRRPEHGSRKARRRWPLALGAAACLAIGVTLGAVVPAHLGTVSGPPGTLGAVESVDFGGEPAGVSVDGDLVAHTWGTETLLSVEGLPAGESYEVVVIDLEGGEHASGTFLGSAVPIECAMNADALREAVAAVEIRDQEGNAVASADVPPVDA